MVKNSTKATKELLGKNEVKCQNSSKHGELWESICGLDVVIETLDSMICNINGNDGDPITTAPPLPTLQDFLGCVGRDAIDDKRNIMRDRLDQIQSMLF